jgi:alpha-galactosidase
MVPFVIAIGSEVIFKAEVRAGVPTEEKVSTPAEPVYLGYPHGPKTAEFVPEGRKANTRLFRLMGPFDAIVTASSEAFACNDRPHTPLGSAYGNPSSLLDNAVYDRKGDWLLTVDDPLADIEPMGRGRFRLRVARKDTCVIRLREHYYRDHLGYFLWQPGRPVWPAPVAGWCSWMAHLQDVTEANVMSAARFFSQNLKQYGYSVIQIDDGYQRVSQFPAGDVGVHEPFSDYWAIPNSKFPSGMKKLAADITDLGLTPGIWIGDYLPLGLNHADGYVTDPDGKPHKGPWVGYAMNGFDEAARNEAYIETVRKLRADGWRYFKIDTLRHILYDSYRKVPDYWRQKGESMEQAYRKILAETKRAAGPDSYLLACWGTIPELAGIPDGARIGEDVGPDVASMRRSAKYIAQFQYLNNVVWRNDPDYMCLRVPIPQAQAWVTLTALAGGHVMVSDPVIDYDPARVDLLRRVGPPMVTRPTSVVPHEPDPEFVTLSAAKGEDSWLVAGRFAWSKRPALSLSAQKLGLNPRDRYLAFDFWKEQFLGTAEGACSFEEMPEGSCQVICYRRLLDHPQLLGTNRHIGQGVVELDDVKWADGALAGVFHRGRGRRWCVYLYAGPGWQYQAVEGEGIDSEVTAHPYRTRAGTTVDQGTVVKLTFPEGDTPMKWRTHWTHWTHRKD